MNAFGRRGRCGTPPLGLRSAHARGTDRRRRIVSIHPAGVEPGVCGRTGCLRVQQHVVLLRRRAAHRVRQRHHRFGRCRRALRPRLGDPADTERFDGDRVVRRRHPHGLPRRDDRRTAGPGRVAPASATHRRNDHLAVRRRPGPAVPAAPHRPIRRTRGCGRVVGKPDPTASRRSVVGAAFRARRPGRDTAHRSRIGNGVLRPSRNDPVSDRELGGSDRPSNGRDRRGHHADRWQPDRDRGGCRRIAANNCRVTRGSPRPRHRPVGAATAPPPGLARSTDEHRSHPPTHVRSRRCDGRAQCGARWMAVVRHQRQSGRRCADRLERHRPLHGRRRRARTVVRRIHHPDRPLPAATPRRRSPRPEQRDPAG